jgi:hypothetical protein
MKIILLLICFYTYSIHAEDFTFSDEEHERIELTTESKSDAQKVVIEQIQVAGLSKYSYAIFFRAADQASVTGNLSEVQWIRIKQSLKTFIKQHKNNELTDTNCQQRYRIDIRLQDNLTIIKGCAPFEKHAYNKLNFQLLYHMTGNRQFPALQ